MQGKNNTLETPVRYFKGVGPKKGAELAKLGIETVSDLLYYLPARYEDRSNFTAIKDLAPGETRTIQGQIITANSRTTKSGVPIFQIAITDQTGIIHAVWFNQPYLKDYLKRSQRIILYGKVEKYDKLQVVQPEYELQGDQDEDESVNIGRIVPVYPATTQITQKYLRALTYLAATKFSKFLKERIPTYILARERMVDIKFAIRNIHFPVNFESQEKAYKRIVFEEFFLLQLALALKKRHAGKDKGALPYSVKGEFSDIFRKALPFELTEAQKKAMADIERDMSSGKTMNRLLEGDVGSGKTVVAAYALALTVQNGFQGVMMAPTEVLARQHFIVLSELLMPFGINVAFLIGGIDPKSRDEICGAIKDGKINIVVGTHAIIQESVEFKRLGLAVVDEQHKFGVAQRAVLKQKGYSPHVLLMTATPIPRTLALTVYGDLDISMIKEMPKGRKPVATYWVEESRREKVYNFIKEELSKGRQAYVICPLIEESASLKNRSKGAAETFDKLKSEVFSDYEVGLLHGRMSSKDKDKIMKDFKKGKIKVLVSTVVIEVGIDVPNATVILIENADRFGLAQLHQLRGRVGRGEHESYCVLLADPKTEDAKERLRAIEETVDGFSIAEADLDIRGPGEFFGTRQHGALPEIRFGNILKDFGIMELARKEAFEIISKDPELAEEHYMPLRTALLERFKDKLDLINVA